MRILMFRLQEKSQSILLMSSFSFPSGVAASTLNIQRDSGSVPIDNLLNKKHVSGKAKGKSHFLLKLSHEKHASFMLPSCYLILMIEGKACSPQIIMDFLLSFCLDVFPSFLFYAHFSFGIRYALLDCLSLRS